MAKLPSPNRDRAVAIVLFCALCGVLLGLGARVLRLRQPPPPARRAVVPVDLGMPAVAAPRAESHPRPDAGAVQASAAQVGRSLWVLVLDGRGQPVASAQVAARLGLSPGELLTPPATAVPARPPAKSATARPQPIGELGVLSGPLPYPEDIIAGSAQAPGSVQRGSSAAAALTVATDDKGVARLVRVPPGWVQLLVNHDSQSAAAEVVVPPLLPDAPPDSEATALRIVLRLGARPDALCTLPGESGEPADPQSASLTSEGPEVAGRVEDGRGFPVSGARLELTSGRVRTQTLSDPRGAFAVHGLPAGALTVQVHHPGYAPLTLNQGADKPRHELRLTLHPGGGVSGRLRDARVGGVPPGAQLYSAGQDGLRQAIALAADGSFVATGLLPGEVTLHARAPGYAPLLLTVKVPAGETPEQVTVPELRLDLLRGATLRGSVRSSDGGAAGVAVTLTELTGAERLVGQLLTDARGEFVATDLPAGKLRIRAVAGSTSATTELELSAGDTHHAELELR